MCFIFFLGTLTQPLFSRAKSTWLPGAILHSPAPASRMTPRTSEAAGGRRSCEPSATIDVKGDPSHERVRHHQKDRLRYILQLAYPPHRQALTHTVVHRLARGR